MEFEEESRSEYSELSASQCHHGAHKVTVVNGRKKQKGRLWRSPWLHRPRRIYSRGCWWFESVSPGEKSKCIKKLGSQTLKHQKEQLQQVSSQRKRKNWPNVTTPCPTVEIERFIWNTVNEFLDLMKRNQLIKMQATWEQGRSDEQRNQQGAGSASQEDTVWKEKEMVKVEVTSRVRLSERWAWLKVWQGLPSEAELQFRGGWKTTPSLVVTKRGTR